MDDTISRQAALDEINKIAPVDTAEYDCNLLDRIDVRYVLTELPSAQPKIIRCKECKWSYDDVSGRICSYGVCVECAVSDDFYCADAERIKK